MEIVVVTGFFGAGKTTFILQYMTNYNGNVAVLVNEFGDLSIDGEVIKKGELEVIELPSGCICCSLRASLPETIDMIYENIKPDLLIIEPSGIATPGNVLSAIKDCKYAKEYIIKPVIGVVDSSTFWEFIDEFGKFYVDQIKTADIILLNKIDLVKLEDAERIEERLKILNPHALIVRTSYCKFFPENGVHERGVEDREFDVNLDALSIIPKKRFTKKELEGILSRIVGGEFGEMVRAKGFVECGENYYMFQISGKRYELVEWSSDKPKAVIIGIGLNKDGLRKLFV